MGDGGTTLFNSQIYINASGVVVGVHRKVQPTYAERFVWAQGSGHTLKVFSDLFLSNEAGDSTVNPRVGGLCCWENTMNLARQTLINLGQQIHCGAWPALSTMSGFEPAANAQIEALMKNHALTAQTFVICSSNYIDASCLNWMEKTLGPQNKVKAGGGWSAIIHPFCLFLAGPYEGSGEQLLTAEIDLEQMGPVKVWIDSAGHYRRPELFQMTVSDAPVWSDDATVANAALKPRESKVATTTAPAQNGRAA